MGVSVRGSNGDVTDVADLDVLRQRVIVQLLQTSTLSPDAMLRYVQDVVRLGILTCDVGPEMSALFRERGLFAELPTSGSPCGANALATVARPNASRIISRFEQDFERLELLGRGAFGEVWRARSRVDSQEYAVKMVRYQFSDESDPLEHPALREVRTSASTEHPHVVRYHSAWVEVDQGSKQGALDVIPNPRNAAWPAEVTSVALDGAARARAESIESSGGAAFEASESKSYHSDGLADSSGGIIFEASEGQHVSSDQVSESLPQQKQEMQILPYKAKAVQKHNATLYVQTELVRGGTLQQWIYRRNAALANPDTSDEEASAWLLQAKDIFLQCIEGVAHLHQEGIVHRDIKPANIMLSENGSVKLGDFGLAKTMANTSGQGAAPALLDLDMLPASEVQGGTRGVGTPAYASPEQMHRGQHRAESDVFSLGVVLAELLCPVRTQMERADLLQGIRAWPTPLLPKAAEAAQPGAEALVLAMTDEDPRKRPRLRDLLAARRLSPRSSASELGNGVGKALKSWARKEMPSRKIQDAD